MGQIQEMTIAAKKKTENKRDAAATKARILSAATEEFADKGYDGARVDEITIQSNVNKNSLYHYFGSKEQLFVAVLEQAYRTLRERQSDLSIRGMPPEEGMRRLVEFNAKLWIEMPELIRLLGSENLHEAKHIKQSDEVPQLYNPIMETIQELLKRGAEEGVFRDDVDPVDLYISISALSAYYIAHRHTFEYIFKTKLMTPRRLKQRTGHAADMIVGYLKTKPAG